MQSELHPLVITRTVEHSHDVYLIIETAIKDQVRRNREAAQAACQLVSSPASSWMLREQDHRLSKPIKQPIRRNRFVRRNVSVNVL